MHFLPYRVSGYEKIWIKKLNPEGGWNQDRRSNTALRTVKNRDVIGTETGIVTNFRYGDSRPVRRYITSMGIESVCDFQTSQ